MTLLEFFLHVDEQHGSVIRDSRVPTISTSYILECWNKKFATLTALLTAYLRYLWYLSRLSAFSINPNHATFRRTLFPHCDWFSLQLWFLHHIDIIHQIHFLETLFNLIFLNWFKIDLGKITKTSDAMPLLIILIQMKCTSKTITNSGELKNILLQTRKGKK